MKLDEQKHSDGITTWRFYCPGCKHDHLFFSDGWDFNNNYEKPTFNPSLLNTKPDTSYRCHLYVNNGQIYYQDDCSHELKGLIIPMKDLNDSI